MASGVSKFVPNPAATQLISRMPGMAGQVLARAKIIEANAKALAPVDEGAYRDSIVAEVGADAKGAFARVNAWDFKALWIEFGTSDTPTFAVLRRAVEASGFRAVSGDDGGS